MPADSAVHAAAKVLAGTGTVYVNGEVVAEHAFGPATVADSMAAQTPFVAVAAGNTVRVAFEDMAGLAGCDYDYNDRAWDGVPVTKYDPPPPTPPTSATFPITGKATLWGGNEGENATLVWEVTNPEPDRFHWKYTLRNNSILTHGAYNIGDCGVTAFSLGHTVSGITNGTTDVPDWFITAPGQAAWCRDIFTNGILPGETGTFEFDTARRPLVVMPANIPSTSTYGHPDPMNMVLGPGDPPTVSIAVDKLIPVNANTDHFDGANLPPIDR